MKASELRIGNYILHEPTIDDWEEIIVTLPSLLQVDISPESYCGIPLTEEWLLKFGFEWVENKTYCNKKEWTLQVKNERYEDGTINRDGTWFDGIGDYSWLPNSNKPKTMVVNTLCRGNYVCGSVGYVHQLQNLYFALTGEEFELKKDKDE